MIATPPSTAVRPADRCHGRAPQAGSALRGRCVLFLAAVLGAFFTNAAGLPGAAIAADPVPPIDMLRQAKRIVVLGDSITADGRWVAFLDAWMQAAGLTADVIDCGLSSETVSGLSEDGHANGKFPRPVLSERLDRVLRVTRPDLVIACYGMNCGIYLPLDEGRMAKFKAGMEQLHATVEKAGARIIHVTPPVYDQRPDAPGPAKTTDYDAVLAAYSDWLVSKRADGWTVIDVHGPMKAMLAECRAKDPACVFSPDCVHPDDAGHWAMCRAVVAALGDSKTAAAPTPAVFAAFMPEVKARLKLLREAYVSAAGHLRPDVAPGLSIAEAEAKARVITDSLRSRRLHLMGGQSGGSVEWKTPATWPEPRVVDPGPAPAAPAPIPSDAVVLFDGRSLDAWKGAENWSIADGIATVGKGTIQTKESFGDCQLHLEFRTPTPPKGKGQGRGNSGVFLMGKYEIQLLDSFPDGTDGPVTYFDGQCGGLYKQQPPAVNATRRPGEWQTYDILFTRPRFASDGTVEKPARISVLHNGVAIHSDTVIKGNTFFNAPPAYERHDDALPITLQDHGDPVQFRSIWVRPFAPLVPVPNPR